MSRPNVPFCPRAWPRVAVLALIGVTAAACSDSARFVQHYDPLAKNTGQANAEVTGSVASRPAAARNVTAQPLPAPSKPQTVAATSHTGTATGAPGLGAYRPARQPEVTGSVTAPSSTQWSREGGTTVTVARGQTIYSIARQYDVPVASIIDANNLVDPNTL